jgi:hypothetical protein
MKTSFVAVLHIGSSKDSQNVYLVGGRVYTALSANTTTFKTPDPALTIVLPELTKLDSLIKSQDGSDKLVQALQNQSELVYKMLKNLCFYVNTVADGDKTIIGLSGFDCKSEASQHNIPEKVIIKRIDNGSVEHSAKIYIIKPAEADRYNVEITTTPADDNSWKMVLNAVPSINLEITGLTRGQEIWTRVKAGNTHGWGPFSDVVAFVPQ